MSNTIHLTPNKVLTLAGEVFEQMVEYPTLLSKMFPIPRGGIPAAFAMKAWFPFTLVDNPAEADCFMDDIIDSGVTKARWARDYPDKPFFALVDKTAPDSSYRDHWVVFPWEDRGDGFGRQSDMEDTVIRLLQQLGEDPRRPGLKETPARVVKAWQAWTAGYAQNPANLLKTFTDGAEACDEMVIVKDIPFYSHCEHHLAPFFGTASIAYIPAGRIVGLSKLSRVLQVFAKRLQVQERLTNQVADAIEEVLSPLGVGVVIKARHLCMESRGICQQGHHTITSALRGALRSNASARAEFMALVQ